MVALARTAIVLSSFSTSVLSVHVGNDNDPKWSVSEWSAGITRDAPKKEEDSDKPQFYFAQEEDGVPTNLNNALEISQALAMDGQEKELSELEQNCMKIVPSLGTMKSPCKLNMVIGAARNLNGVKGDIVEGGVAEGGGILPILYYLGCTGGLKDRTIHLFDTWEGLKPTKDDPTFEEGQYLKTIEEFQKNAEAYGALYDHEVGQGKVSPSSIKDWKTIWAQVTTHKGLFADTMPGVLAERDVGLLMCDGDMYSSTKDCMEAGGPRVVAGGSIYNDDYFAFKECNKAVEEWLEADKRPRSEVFIVSNKEPCSVNVAKECVAPSGEGPVQKQGVCKVGDEELPFEASVFRIDPPAGDAPAADLPIPQEQQQQHQQPSTDVKKPEAAAKPKNSKPEKAKSPAKSPAKAADKAKSSAKAEDKAKSASKSTAEEAPANNGDEPAAASPAAAATPDAAPEPVSAAAEAPAAPAQERQAAVPAQRKHKKVKYAPAQDSEQ